MKDTNIPFELRPLRTHKEVGQILGVSRGTIYNEERSALIKLRKCLAHHDPRPPIQQRTR